MLRLVSNPFLLQEGCTLTIDTDECAENTDNCSQNCSDTLGSYQCVCYDGYTLDSDQHTCNGEHTIVDRYTLQS